MKTAKKRTGGSKLSRSETVTVRMDPRLLYLAEVAARKQRRTISSYVEWAVEQSFKLVELKEGIDRDPITVENERQRLWHVDEAERFVRLAIYYNELLDIQEQERWRVLRETAFFKDAKFKNRNGETEYKWEYLESEVLPVLRRHWDKLLLSIDDGDEATNSWVDEINELNKNGGLFAESQRFASDT